MSSSAIWGGGINGREGVKMGEIRWPGRGERRGQRLHRGLCALWVMLRASATVDVLRLCESSDAVPKLHPVPHDSLLGALHTLPPTRSSPKLLSFLGER